MYHFPFLTPSHLILPECFIFSLIFHTFAFHLINSIDFISLTAIFLLANEFCKNYGWLNLHRIDILLAIQVELVMSNLNWHLNSLIYFGAIFYWIFFHYFFCFFFDFIMKRNNQNTWWNKQNNGVQASELFIMKFLK